MYNDLAIFAGHQIRRTYDEKTEISWLSVVSIIQAGTQQAYFQIVRNYWNKLKERLNQGRLPSASSSPAA